MVISYWSPIRMRLFRYAQPIVQLKKIRLVGPDHLLYNIQSLDAVNLLNLIQVPKTRWRHRRGRREIEYFSISTRERCTPCNYWNCVKADRQYDLVTSHYRQWFISIDRHLMHLESAVRNERDASDEQVETPVRLVIEHTPHGKNWGWFWNLWWHDTLLWYDFMYSLNIQGINRQHKSITKGF